MDLTVQVTKNADELFPKELEGDKKHYLISHIDLHGTIHLIFSSALSIRQFSLSLIQEAVYGQISEKCFQPLMEDDGYLCIIDGVRMGVNSGTLFIFYDEIPEAQLPNKIFIGKDFKLTQLQTEPFNHQLFLFADSNLYKNYAYLTFPSRKLMYLFGLDLLHQFIIKGTKQLKSTELFIPIKGKNIKIQLMQQT